MLLVGLGNESDDAERSFRIRSDWSSVSRIHSGLLQQWVSSGTAGKRFDVVVLSILENLFTFAQGLATDGCAVHV